MWEAKELSGTHFPWTSYSSSRGETSGIKFLAKKHSGKNNQPVAARIVVVLTVGQVILFKRVLHWLEKKMCTFLGFKVFKVKFSNFLLLKYLRKDNQTNVLKVLIYCWSLSNNLPNRIYWFTKSIVRTNDIRRGGNWLKKPINNLKMKLLTPF